MKESKSNRRPALKIAILSAIALFGVWFVAQLPRIQISIESPPPDGAPVIETPPEKVAKAEPSVNPEVVAEGNFRISNRSDHPLRVALRARSLNDSNSKSTSATKEFTSPAHWDFEPGEGSKNGLLVSLPDRAIKLKRGDILFAFAQDGSQRYWGPYIVGETDLPRWNAQTKEWELMLEK